MMDLVRIIDPDCPAHFGKVKQIERIVGDYYHMTDGTLWKQPEFEPLN